MNDAFRERLQRERSVECTLRIHPNARTNRIKEQMANGVWKVDVAAAPEDGAANDVLRRFLADTFNLPLSHVEILSGHTSRLKRVRLTAAPIA